ncbi:response regulator [Sediminibacillus halophilus]|uniref:Two-component system, CitB family, response regulator CitT n=1 Tax=Sediminibacillus halophilus TaxID=482461 RepID=A0A1G9S071_9BACI|nr:response regulator [Sediminibacillus halophilus]SDM28873.1 two-component system, CitB family, response regulator CitT [Sediminibacillus halophilus]
MLQVIIAEDDFRVAQIHEAFLEKVPGMKLVGKAVNAKETLQLLSKHAVDLILLDVYMPDQLGTDLLQRIRESYPMMDIIMITAATDKAYLEKSLSYGVQDYLIKPVTIEQFQQSMQKYKKKRDIIQSTKEVDEELLREVFGSKNEQKSTATLPTGIDYRTLEKVKEILSIEQNGVTSEQAAEKIGASRTTARRYLEYLVGINEAVVEQMYGIVGRPERRYSIIR